MNSCMLAKDSPLDISEFNNLGTRSRAFRLRRIQCAVKKRIDQSMEFIVASPAYSAPSLETSSSTFLPTVSKPAIATMPLYQSHKQPPSPRETTCRPSIPLRSSQADQGSRGKRVHFEDESPNSCIPELSGSYSYLTELSGLSIHEATQVDDSTTLKEVDLTNTLYLPPTCRTKVQRGAAELPTGEGSQCTGGESFQPHELSVTGSHLAPPPYTLTQHGSTVQRGLLESDSLENKDYDDSNSHDTTIARVPHQDSELWVDPITIACRQLMRDHTPTTTTSLFDNYGFHRQDTRAKPDYRWYFNFRYTSFVFQLDIAAEVFLVSLDFTEGFEVSSNTARREPLTALAYLFEDCLVFARSPSTDLLSDPNEETYWAAEAFNYVSVLENGLEVIEDLTMWFSRVNLLAITSNLTLVIECLTLIRSEEYDPKQSSLERLIFKRSLFRIDFQTRRQRAKVFKAIQPWVTRAEDQRLRQCLNDFPRRCHAIHSRSFDNLSLMHGCLHSSHCRNTSPEHSLLTGYNHHSYKQCFYYAHHRCQHHSSRREHKRC